MSHLMWTYTGFKFCYFHFVLCLLTGALTGDARIPSCKHMTASLINRDANRNCMSSSVHLKSITTVTSTII